MPLDGTVPAASPWAQRLARLKRFRSQERAEQCQRRRFSKRQLFMANLLLAEIIDGADFITEATAWDDDIFPIRLQNVCLLVTMPIARFHQLCAYGAELEDAEDGGDHEPTGDKEHDLGWPERVAQPVGQFGTEDGEPSLGSLGMTDQRRWHDGSAVPYGDDLEADNCNDEPSLGATEPSTASDQIRWASSGNDDREQEIGSDNREDDPAEQGEPDYRNCGKPPMKTSSDTKPLEHATTDPESGRPGKWVLTRRAVGGSR